VIATLAKKTGALEAAFWAKAEPIEIPFHKEVFDVLSSLWPLEDVVIDRWLKSDPEAAAMNGRALRLLQSLPPPHPAFLPDEHEQYRQLQWSYYHRVEHRQISERLNKRILEKAVPVYDVQTIGLVGVSLRLFERDIDIWMAQQEYTDGPARLSREEYACNQIELHRIYDCLLIDANWPSEQKTREELWQRAIIAWADHCYGRTVTEQDLAMDRQMWGQLDADMEAGKPATESEAAMYFHDLDTRHTRKTNIPSYLPGEKAYRFEFTNWPR
jgi:hypothetical protein